MGDPAHKPAPDVSSQAREADDLEEEWGEEIDRRIGDTESGGDQGTPWKDVKARLQAKYGWS